MKKKRFWYFSCKKYTVGLVSQDRIIIWAPPILRKAIGARFVDLMCQVYRKYGDLTCYVIEDLEEKNG